MHPIQESVNYRIVSPVKEVVTHRIVVSLLAYLFVVPLLLGLYSLSLYIPCHPYENPTYPNSTRVCVHIYVPYTHTALTLQTLPTLILLGFVCVCLCVLPPLTLILRGTMCVSPPITLIDLGSV